jgi:hypothetical protein
MKHQHREPTATAFTHGNVSLLRVDGRRCRSHDWSPLASARDRVADSRNGKKTRWTSFPRPVTLKILSTTKALKTIIDLSPPRLRRRKINRGNELRGVTLNRGIALQGGSGWQ